LRTSKLFTSDNDCTNGRWFDIMDTV